MSNGYDVAQICINGHVINSMSQSYPVHNQKFCDKCGERTISECPKCKTPIRGYYLATAIVVIGSDYSRPSFCHNCGQPYPWTEKKLQAAQELAQELHKLSEEEKDLLKKSLDDIIRDTSQTPVAVARFKRLVAKAGVEAAQAFKDILVDIVSETVKKGIWPS